MFRRLNETIRSGAETALNERTPAADLKPWLLQHRRWQLGRLEEHHQVDDLHYFQVFRRTELRLAPGFELLEREHEALHKAICGIVQRANAVLVAEDTDGATFRTELPASATPTSAATSLRHLDDEEDLVIPLLLERGKRSLVGAI